MIEERTFNFINLLKFAQNRFSDQDNKNHKICNDNVIYIVRDINFKQLLAFSIKHEKIIVGRINKSRPYKIYNTINSN